MPWRERTGYQMRDEFVKRVQAREGTIAALCREYGISRRTGYKWLARAEAGEGLEEQSRRPAHTQRIPEEIEQKIVKYRKQYPAIGAEKLRHMMQDEGFEGLPSVKTFNNVLNRNGLIRPEASQKATPYRRFEKTAANEMWQADFLGKYRLGNGEYCHTLNVLDDYSRYSLCCAPLHTETFEEVRPELTRVFRENGLPRIFLCDNGNPWGTAQTVGFTRFEVWLMEHGILPIHGRALHPQTQGKEERFNGSLRRELLKQAIPANWQDALEKHEAYRCFYNEKWPHHALNLDTPSQHYTPSKRNWSDTVTAWEYPEGMQLRQVRGNGCFNWEGQGYFLSYGFAEKEIAIRPSQIDGCISLFFHQFRIARIDIRRQVYTLKRIYLIEGDPRL